MQTPASDRHTNSSKTSLNLSYSIFETLSTVVSPIEHARIKEELENHIISSLPNVAPRLSQARKDFDIVNGKKGVIPPIPESLIAIRLGDGLDETPTWRE